MPRCQRRYTGVEHIVSEDAVVDGSVVDDGAGVAEGQARRSARELEGRSVALRHTLALERLSSWGAGQKCGGRRTQL